MSKRQFEQYLVEEFAEWARTKVGSEIRFQFRSPDEHNSEALFNAFAGYCSGHIQDGETQLPTLLIQGVKLIPVLHGKAEPGFSEYYIAHLRDLVAGQSKQFENTALLVIHNSLLDTILNSALDLAAPGNVWDPAVLKNRMESLLKGDAISRLLLKDQFNLILDLGDTVFGLRPIYNSLDDGKLEFAEIGLFNDQILLQLGKESAQARSRVRDNRSLRETIEFELEHYPSQIKSRLARFDLGAKFIKKNFVTSDSWRDLDFQEYKVEQQRNKQHALDFEKFEPGDGVEFRERPKSLSKAGQRDRSILLLVDNDGFARDFSLVFRGARIEDNEVKVSHSDVALKHILKRSADRTRIRVQVPTGAFPVYFQLQLKRDKRSENYQFRFAVLPKGYLPPAEQVDNCFRVEPRRKRISLQREENILRINAEGARTAILEVPNETIDANAVDVLDFNRLANESDLVSLRLKRADCETTFNIEGIEASVSVTLPFLFSRMREKLFQNDRDVEYNQSKGKLIVDSSEVTLVAVRQQLINFEAQMVKSRLLAVTMTGSIALDDLAEIDAGLHQAYSALYDYYETKRTLPSLVAWGPAYQDLVRRIVVRYSVLLGKIMPNDVLSRESRRLLHIGFFFHDQQEKLSPIYPLTLAYNLELVSRCCDENEGGLSDLADVTLERLSPHGLIPYIYTPLSSAGYGPVRPIKDNPFWLYIAPQSDPEFSFVRKLVRDKISEFCKAYATLFDSRTGGTLRLNCINQGSAEQILRGLLDYFRDELTNSLDVHVNFYDASLCYNAFDKLAETRSSQVLRDWLGLEKAGYKDKSDTLIHLLRTRLTYSKFTHSDRQQYAHIAFFRDSTPVAYEATNLDSALSGILADGLMSSYASERKGESYFSGFGVRDIEMPDGGLLALAAQVNSLLRPARRENTQYLPGQGHGLTVNTEFRTLLASSYDSALWTTIIDPRVNLDFFAGEEGVVLIHFSDQYTSAAGYDAITVTTQVNLYEHIFDNERLTTELNAFNGTWLLQMLTANEKIVKEHLGIIGAYKFMYSILSTPEISWVPLSVAEMIRVAGNIGLRMSDSEFSRNVQGYKRGAISDDVLFVGFGEDSVYLVPVEVKTGAPPDFAHASNQARELSRYLLEDVLGPDTFASQLYRALFVRQVLMQVEKYQLYKVLKPEQLNRLLDRREWWLRGRYRVSALPDYPVGAIIAHIQTPSFHSPKYSKMDDVLRLELPYGVLDELVTSSVAENTERLSEVYQVPHEYCLRHRTVGGEAGHEDAAESSPDEEELTAEPQPPTPLIEPPSAAESLRVLLGHKEFGGKALWWEPTNTDKFLNPNSGIIGTMGTGKTQFTKSLVTQLVKNQEHNVGGTPVGILIFDYKSDYIDDAFVSATNAQTHKLHRLPYNPLSLHGNMPMLPLHTATSFVDTIERAYHLGKKQGLTLRELILEAYENKGISRADSSTWNLTPPTIDTVWHKFLAQEKVEKDSLYAALSELFEFQIFETDPAKMKSLYDLTQGVTVIELAGYSPNLQNLIVGLTLDLFYSQMQKSGKPELRGDYRQLRKIVLVDEADNFMSQDFAALRKILKEGREYGVGVVLSTQDITHFKTSENDYSAYILTWIVHRVSSIQNKDIKAIFNVDDRSEQNRLMEDIRQLEKHYSLFIDGDKGINKMRDRAFFELLAQA